MNCNTTTILNVRRKPFIIIASGWIVIALLLTLPMSFDAKAQQTYEFKMAHAEAIGSPITNAFEKWGKILEKQFKLAKQLVKVFNFLFSYLAN